MFLVLCACVSETHQLLNALLICAGRHVVTRGQAPATKHDKRVMFAKGLFDVVLVPLNGFQGGQAWTG